MRCFKTVLIPIMSVNLTLRSNDLSKFSEIADRISKSISLKVYGSKREYKLDNGVKAYENIQEYQFDCGGKKYTLIFSGKGLIDKDDAKLKSREDSIEVFSNEVKLGKDYLYSRKYYELTDDASKALLDARTKYYEYIALPRKDRDKRIEKMMLENINHINKKQREEKKYHTDAVSYFAHEQDVINEEQNTRTLIIQGGKYSGKNPIASGNANIYSQQSVSSSWHSDSRGTIQKLDDLERIGLIDSSALKCSRIIWKNIPLDGWMPKFAPINSREVRTGNILPYHGHEGKSIKIGSSKLISDAVPLYTRSVVDNIVLPTFMIREEFNGPINSKNDYSRPSSQNIKFGWHQATMLPIAGMDEDNRVFVMTWVAVANNSGLFILIKYSDESSPRLAFVEASGVIFRIQNDYIEMGINSQNTSDEKRSSSVKWSGDRSSDSNDNNYKIMKFKPIQSIGVYKHKDAGNVIQNDEWKNKITVLTMPRSLW